MKRAIGLFAVLAALGTTVPAGAQSDEERAGARVAAQAGAKAFAEGRWADAVDLFTRAESLVHAPPHLLWMARAQVKLGQLVGARETYTKVVKETIPPNAPDAFRAAQEAGRTELEELVPRIPMVTAKVTNAEGKKYRLWVDGKEVPAALVGLPKPVDPGEHTLQVATDALASKATKVAVVEKDEKTVELALEPGVPLPAGAAAPPPEAPPEEKPAAGGDENGTDAPAGGQGGSGPEKDAGATEGTSGMRYGAYGALGLGAVGLGLGTVFALQSGSKRDEVVGLCPGGQCPVEKRSEIEAADSDARSAQTLSIVGFVVGGLGLAAGVTLWVLDSGSKGEADTAGVHPWIGPGSAGVVGRF
ncbi:MAG: hypothetical protein IT376_09840 [Polyangiaceae bacterium]|nr:hypothetical protein [Polyangiaceae bacterium]